MKIVKTALLTVLLITTVVSISEAVDTKKQLNNFWNDVVWTEKIVRSYFSSDLSKKNTVLYLQQKREKAQNILGSFSSDNGQYYLRAVKSMLAAVKKDKWTQLYKELKKLNKLKASLLDRYFQIVLTD